MSTRAAGSPLGPAPRRDDVSAGDDGIDLRAIATEAQAEIMAAELLRGVERPESDTVAMLATAELGYYEAELRSLRAAALRTPR